MKIFIKILISTCLFLYISSVYSILEINPDTKEITNEVYENVYPDENFYPATSLVLTAIATCAGIIAGMIHSKCSTREIITEIEFTQSQILRQIEEFEKNRCDRYIRTYGECAFNHKDHNHSVSIDGQCIQQYKNNSIKAEEFMSFWPSEVKIINMCTYLLNGSREQNEIGKAFLELYKKECTGRTMLEPVISGHNQLCNDGNSWLYGCGRRQVNIKPLFRTH